jgi:plasmid stabilization system protein ParE
MVVYSELAKQDLIDLLYGLLTWNKHELSIEHAERYVDDIVDVTDSICKKTVHKNFGFETHLNYGEKVYIYRRNNHTTWYVIYDWDKTHRTAYVNKIMNNHITKW